MTAVIVAHDGASWLPQVADAVLEQTRPVQRVVAVDTGSRDRSGAVLAAKFGQAAVFGMDRATGYGDAIARALQHRAAKTPVPGQAGERTEWLWLLHDDCEPAPDALEQLLRGTVETSSAAVLGPKIRDWANREVILEAGITLDTATRRITGIEPREVDQGQHDGDRDSLAVSSAGMLVRRDVWEQVGGFDPAMGLFMEDIDFCWRVHAAGYRVRVITDAVVYHVRAATKRKRPVSVGRRPRMLDRRNGLLTLLGNLPLRPMLGAAAGNLLVSLLRVMFFLLAKRLSAAVDELTALTSVLLHPFRLITMRRRRARGRRAAFSRVRADLPPGHSGRRLAEFMMAALSKSQADKSGSHHATDDPTDDDSMLVDDGLGKRLLTSPTLFTFVALTAIALTACRSLIGAGLLGGGSLMPAWGGSGSLWTSYIQTFHPSGIGSTTPAPPWLAVLAALATVLGGKPWLAIDVILIGCVPLSGLTAMAAVRKLTTSGLVRVWAAMTYALLPVAMGVIAQGRFGTAVAFVLLPVIVSQAARMTTTTGPRATRAAWATGLLVAIGAAFVPLLWLIALAACLLAAVVFRTTRRGLLRNLAIISLTAPVLLMPWTLTVFSNPSGLLLEAGLPQSGAPAFSLPARSLLLLSPGGPGLPPYWVTGGLFLVAFAALFGGRRRRLIVAGWGLALSGLLAGVMVSHLIVHPADGGPVTVWSGLPLALAAAGLLLAAAAAADGRGRAAGGPASWRSTLRSGPWIALLGLIACATPVLAAASWLSTGVNGPVHRVSSPVVPELVAAAGGQTRQVRTLVLRSSGGQVAYLLLRGPSPTLADSALTPPADAQQALSKMVSTLTTPGGNLAADQARILAQFDIGFVLVQAPVDPQLAIALNDVSGLQFYSETSRYTLWKLNSPPARVVVREPAGTLVPVSSGATGVAGVAAPAAGGTLMLAEPAGGWHASVNGQALTAVPSPAGSWAQAFRLPSGGGTLTVGHSGLTRDLVLILELLAFLVVAALALPGIHVAEQEESAVPAEGDRPAGREGSRMSARRAAAGAGAAGTGVTAAGATGTGTAGTGRGATGSEGADPAGARTAVMDRAGEPDDSFAGRGLAGAGSAGAGLAGAGQAGAGMAAGARAAGPGGPDLADDAGEAEGSGTDVAAGRRGLTRSGRGRAGGRGTRGRTAKGRAAGRQRTALTKDAPRSARAGRGAGSPDGDYEDGPDTTLMAGGRELSADRGPGGDRNPGGDRAGRDDGRRSRRLPDAWPHAERDDGRLADAWPYTERDDGRLADAWPHASSGTERTVRYDGGASGQHSYRPAADAAGGDAPSRRSGQHAYPDPLGGSRDSRPGYREDDLAARPSGGGRRDHEQDRPEPGWRSPSGRSPGGDWPFPELDAAGGRDGESGRSPSGRAPDDSWPGRDSGSGVRSAQPERDPGDDLPPWRSEQGTRAYRVTGPGQSGSAAADRDPASRSGTGPQRAFGPRGDGAGEQRDRTGGGRHGAGYPGYQDERYGRTPDAAPEYRSWNDGADPLSWPGTSAGPGTGAAGGELEPLPPLQGQGRGQTRPGSRDQGPDPSDWDRLGEEPGDRRYHRAPADYESEYEGDNW
ncbi:MAG TPA: glycosyltransferase [Streptosporangiaceae bacterium]